MDDQPHEPVLLLDRHDDAPAGKSVHELDVDLWALGRWSRTAWPRRKIRWSARVSPLVSYGAAHTDRITVGFAGTRLDTPQIIEVEVSNVGNKDFEPAHFLGTPIEIMLTGGTVVSTLRETSEPTVRRVLHATEHGDRVALDTSTPLHKGQTVQQRGSLKVTVSQVDNEAGHIRLHIRVDNGYPNAVELDDAGGAFVAHDDRGHSYNGDYIASQWPATVPAGGPMWGVIELEGFIQPGARLLSISFTHTFSDSFDAPDNITVDNISLPS
ncbi:hypothetical protein ACWGQ5_12770 [Streptomyces sp. NPDC055722]